MYQVLDNDKPADCKHHNVGTSWNQSKFETFAEAVIYANEWIGLYGPYDFKLNEKFYYGGMNDFVIIIPC